ncbi:penicillin-binding protein [Bacillus daqingensis]|uniref:serine-type D-Ala-D-Ala carboxypeptidase n=1 Tax=Bacillus daqingensis TaxID=872396 RepID=A0ABV9NQ47_9BACI
MEADKQKVITRRALYILMIFAAAILIMFSRFAYIQASKEVQEVDLENLLERRWTQTMEIDGERGSILDRTGEVLAEEIPSYTIVAVLDDSQSSYVEDPGYTASQLAEVLEVDPAFLEAQLSRESHQVELGPAAKNMSFEKMRRVEELELPGIVFREDPRRYYPMQTFASHVIGYTERDMSEARMGLENSLNEYLRDEPGEISYQQDGRAVPLAGVEERIQEPVNGADVSLTIDARIQTAMEQTMNQVDELYEPERMMAVAAHAETGEILALSNRPSFNPNEYEDIENFTNYVISSRFEPGSTMKIFTLAAAIEEGVYEGDEEFTSGSYEIFDRRIHDHNNGEGWGDITFNEGVQRSSNVAFSKIAMEILGPEKLYEYVTEFGFREPTGIDLPNEVNGGDVAETYPIDAATTAFGQATSVSPMQQVKAATAIANDGKMMNPYIVSAITDGTTGEPVYEASPEIAGEPISAETAAEVRDIMKTVVTEEAGTGRAYAIDGFDVAGKTGTAQIPAEEGGGYMSGHGKNIFSFIGMAPAEDPEVIVYVAVDRPELEPSQLGNEPVSMIFRQVMEQSLQYLNIAPTEESQIDGDGGTEITVEDYSGAQAEDVSEQLITEGLDVYVLGDGGEIVGQSAEEGVTLAHGTKLFLKTEGDASMPDMSGWSLRSVQQAASLMDMQVESEGQGFAVDQRPEPGSSTSGAGTIRILLDMDEPGEQVEEETDEDDNEDEDEDDETFFMD